MAMIPGCEYDLFISYAHADDLSGEESEGWVAQFVARLRGALGMRMGTSKELVVFFDNSTVESNTRLPQLLEAVRASAIFLAIGSPSYVSHDWPRRELAAFVERHQDLGRLFMIEVMPLNAGERYPSPLHENIHSNFWKPTGKREIPMPLSVHEDQREFATLIHTLAADLAKKLLALRLLPSPSPMQFVATTAARSSNTPTPEGKRKTVLIAQSTDDVEDEADQLRSCLQQFADEIVVLPSGTYPQNGHDFIASFQADLAQADLVVQLLGKRAGRTPPDLPQGYTRYQAEAARSAKVVMLQWRRPDIDPEATPDAGYKALLKSETVIACGLEAFKLQILKEIRKSVRPHPPVRPSTVFINADDKDLSIAREVERECLRAALPAILPMTGDSAEDNRKDLAENLIDCDVLVFIYGDTTQNWIRSQLRFFNKVRPQRELPPKLLAICSGPPPKPDIGISFPEAHIIDCPTGWDLAPIRQLIVELGE